MSNLVCIEYSDSMIGKQDNRLNREDIFAIDRPSMFLHCIFQGLLEDMVPEDKVLGDKALGDMALVVWQAQVAKVFYTSYTIPKTHNILFCTDKYQTSIKS